MANWGFGLGAYVCVCFNVPFLCLVTGNLWFLWYLPWGVGWGGLSSSKWPRARALGLSDGAAHVTVSKPLIYPLPFLHATVKSDSLDLWGPTHPLVPT